jgi:hypothetical protein
MSRRLSPIRLSAVLLAVAAIGGCGSRSADVESQSSTRVAVDTTKISGTPTTDLPILPLQKYFQSGEEIRTVEQAQDVLVTECAKRHGIAWDTAETAVPYTFKSRRLWGVMTSADAQTYGYHVPLDMGTRAPTGLQTDRYSEQQRKILYGESPALGTQKSPRTGTKEGQHTESGGCFGEASRKLATATFGNVAEQLGADAHNRTAEDPRTIEIYQEWSDCMASKGHQYPTPYAALADPRWNLEDTNSAPTATELSTAADDVSCKIQTGLIRRLFDLEADLEDVNIHDHRHALDADTALWRTTVQTARRILAQIT